MKDQDKYKEVDERFDKEFPIEDFCSAHSDYIPHNIKLFIHAYIDLAERRVIERIFEVVVNSDTENLRSLLLLTLSSLKSENKNKDI